MFYHINREVPYGVSHLLNVGDEIKTEIGFNPYFSYYEKALTYTVIQPDGSIIQVNALRLLQLVRDNVVTPHTLPFTAWQAAHHFMQYTREIIMEDVRKTYYANLPSRQKCIWLIDSVDEVGEWISKLKCENGKYQVLVVEAIGNIHEADENFLLGDSEPYSITIENAHKYWNGEFTSDAKKELLFEGKIKVIDILKV